MRVLALSPFFWKGIAVTVAGVILFMGTVYVLLTAVFGWRMAYLVLAVSLFGWMIILSALWAFGAPGTPRNLGPRGTEPHWQVFAAGTQAVRSARVPETASYPGGPWRPPTAETRSAVESVTTAIQRYLVVQAGGRLAQPGGTEGQQQEQALRLDPSMFDVEDVRFATAADGTRLVGAQAFFTQGGPRVTVFAFDDPGNVPVYSWAFFGASIVGFLVHLPFLDRAERKRKEILTGGTAPPWYGPA